MIISIIVLTTIFYFTINYTNFNVRDIIVGYSTFSYEFDKTFPVLSKGFEIETKMTIRLLDKNFLLKEI